MSLIMLIDDDSDMLELTKRWITKAGHEALCVTSGKEALDILKTSKPDLILLDAAMPEMDGPAVFEAIKADESMRDIPVVFRTGKDDEESEALLKALNPAGIVSKSEGRNALLTAVSKFSI